MARVVSVVQSTIALHLAQFLLRAASFLRGRKKGLSVATMGLAFVLFRDWPAAQQQIIAPVRTDTNLRVISYNAQFLPLEVLNKRRKSAYRVVQQTKRLVGYDIVGLNEVFHEDRRAELLQLFRGAWGVDFHFVTSRETDRSAFGLDSGLVLLSRLPIVESHSLVFGNDSTFRERGILNDGFAKKGVLHARIRRTTPQGETLIDCFLTHLESKDPVRRREQYTKVADFIRQHSSPDFPVVLMGDFNTDGDQEEIENPNSAYHRLMNELETAREDFADLGLMADRTTWGTRFSEQPSGGDRIDYIFVSNPESKSALEAIETRSLNFADPRVGYLSDHCAVEAIFR